MVGGGFTCPDCDGQVRLIVDTRPDDSPHQERVLRLRRCPDCGYELDTVEVPADRRTARIPDVSARRSQLRESRRMLVG